MNIRTALLIVFALSVTVGADAASITFGWNPVLGAVGYRVYYQPDSPTPPFTGTGASEGASPISAGSNLTATISGLGDHTYFFAITAYNAGGESGYSGLVVSNDFVLGNGQMVADLVGDFQ